MRGRQQKRERGKGDQSVKQEMSKIQIFFKLNLKTLGFARCCCYLRLLLSFCLLAFFSFFLFVSQKRFLHLTSNRSKAAAAAIAKAKAKADADSDAFYAFSARSRQGVGLGVGCGGLRIKSPMKNDQSWQRQIESKKKYG